MKSALTCILSVLFSAQLHASPQLRGSQEQSGMPISDIETEIAAGGGQASHTELSASITRSNGSLPPSSSHALVTDSLRLKDVRRQLNEISGYFIAATKTIDMSNLQDETEDAHRNPVVALVKLALNMEAEVASLVPRLLQLIDAYTKAQSTSSQTLSLLATSLQQSLQSTELPTFVQYTAELIGMPKLNVANATSLMHLSADLSRVLTEYILKKGKTSSADPNPSACVDDMVASLRADLDFMTRRQYAHADCSMADSSSDCAGDVAAMLSKYAFEAKLVVLTAFDCGGVIDTCTQLIANARVNFVRSMRSLIIALEDCKSSGQIETDFFEGYCKTDLLNSMDDLRQLTESLRGVTQVCQIDGKEARDLDRAIADLTQMYKSPPSDPQATR